LRIVAPPLTSRVVAGIVVPIPTLLLLIVILAIPEVSNVNCDVPAKCIPVDKSAEKLYAGIIAVPEMSASCCPTGLLPLSNRYALPVHNNVAIELDGR
jgi:hypothetical protein